MNELNARTQNPAGSGPGPMLAGSTAPKGRGVPPRNPAGAQIVQAIIEAYQPETFEDLTLACRDVIGQLCGRMLDAELDVHLERENEKLEPGERFNRRNGHTGKTVKSTMGSVLVDVPRDRGGTFTPALIPKHCRDVSGFESKVLGMISRGMSQRDIVQTVEEIYGFRVSHETVSRIAESIGEEVVKWRNRPLQPVYAFVFVDCIYASARSGRGEKASQQAVYVMLGIDLDGRKDVIALEVNPTEGKSHWMNIFDSLRQRGVQDILFLSMDGVTGLEEGVKAIFPKAKVQRCIVHLMRNSLKYVAQKDYGAFTKDIKAVYAAVSRDECRLNFEAFKKLWSEKCPGAVRVWETHFDQVLQLFNYPSAIRKIIYTTNAIESVNSSLRKITKKGSFDSYDALLRAFYLRIQELSRKWTGRAVHGWTAVRNQLAIHEEFEERIRQYIDK